MSKKTLWPVFVLLLLSLSVAAYFVPRGGSQGGVACTEEAKLCPDGTAVGRTGPNCEFAECPSNPAINASRDLAIGMNATIGGTTISVLGLAEDSRCPSDVQCIQAGTVRVRTSISGKDTKEVVFTLGQPQVVESLTISLVSVIPGDRHSTQIVQPSDYRFTFSVTTK